MVVEKCLHISGSYLSENLGELLCAFLEEVSESPYNPARIKCLTSLKHRGETYLWNYQPGKTQTSLFTYRDYETVYS